MNGRREKNVKDKFRSHKDYWRHINSHELPILLGGSRTEIKKEEFQDAA
jgi:uncharacterized C2H2 Zn-finger protein